MSSPLDSARSRKVARDREDKKRIVKALKTRVSKLAYDSSDNLVRGYVPLALSYSSILYRSKGRVILLSDRQIRYINWEEFGLDDLRVMERFKDWAPNKPLSPLEQLAREGLPPD